MLGFAQNTENLSDVAVCVLPTHGSHAHTYKHAYTCRPEAPALDNERDNPKRRV